WTAAVVAETQPQRLTIAMAFDSFPNFLF
ncbi:MAG: hypothetical protein QOD03_13, partial [Verrucomicrobiota bacterium]